MSYSNDSDLAEIKERIYDEGMVEFLLEELDCQHIKRVRNDRFEAGLPVGFNSDNRRSVQIRNTESLNGSIRNKGISGDIFVIFSYILYGAEDFQSALEHLYQVKAFICNALGWDEYLSDRDDFSEPDKPRVDPLAFLRSVQKQRKQRARKDSLAYKENHVISESVMSRYFNYSHWSFVKDGILPRTQKEFGVMFDRESERITFPIHNKNGELIGVKGRYVGKNKRILDEIKYIFLHRCDKSIELYGYHKALPYIKEKGEVIVVESEKTVMLLWQWGYRNTVALMGSEMSPIQAMMLKQLEADIIFAFDKDMEVEHVKKQAKQIKSRICKMIMDKDDLLDEKSAPVDKGVDVWKSLYDNHVYSTR